MKVRGVKRGGGSNQNWSSGDGEKWSDVLCK